MCIRDRSNTAVPKYYGMFRDAVIRGEIPVCKEVSMEMNRIDDLIANPGTVSYTHLDVYKRQVYRRLMVDLDIDTVSQKQ